MSNENKKPMPFFMAHTIAQMVNDVITFKQMDILSEADERDRWTLIRSILDDYSEKSTTPDGQTSLDFVKNKIGQLASDIAEGVEP